MKTDYIEKIKDLISTQKVVALADIQTAFPDRSRISIVRYLQGIGTITSYNKSGSFLTMATIPEYNTEGVWEFRSALFSAHGSLMNTVKHHVSTSPNGMTQEELEIILRMPVYNELRKLTQGGQIVRGKPVVACGAKRTDVSMYFSADSTVRTVQIETRVRQSAPFASLEPAGMYAVYEVLRAFIEHSNLGANEIHKLLRLHGTGISLAQVGEVFHLYDLGKKNSP